jgi:hypothetical protein
VAAGWLSISESRQQPVELRAISHSLMTRTAPRWWAAMSIGDIRGVRLQSDIDRRQRRYAPDQDSPSGTRRPPMPRTRVDGSLK